MSKKALIIGISGQDGSYLAKFLLKKDYEVWGSSRDSLGNSFKNLNKLAIIAELKLISIVVEDFRSVLVGIKKAKPDEIYFLAGQSSVGLSFEQPVETIQSILIGILNVLEAVKMVDHPVRVYHAGSSEVFGDTLGSPATELTPFRPRSPYGLAKASAFWSVDNYREAYNLYACTGLLFNLHFALKGL
jgi:GDPmannose 4,6-dehydratase